jgi:hypothetical protein
MAQQNQNQAPQLQTQTAEVQAPKAQTLKEQKFLVTEDAEIPRGGSSYKLAKGKTISSHGYDIEALKRQGVKLREVSEPGN